MNRINRVHVCVLSLLLSLSVFCSSAAAQEAKTNELMEKGIYLFRQENYDEAAVVFEQAVQKQPRSSLAAYYLGLTYKRLENYVEARKYLEASLSMTPKIKGALIEEIDLLYRLNEFEAAKKWINIAEEEGVRPAQAKFLKGLTAQKSGEDEVAIQAFKDAKDLDDRLTQSADYQIGICYLRMKKYKDARDTFKDTFALDPHSDIGTYANKYMELIDRRLEIDKPFHFQARFAFDYDSNVTLLPGDASLVGDISDKADTRQVFDLKGDYTFRLEDSPLSLKTGYGMQIAKQNDLGHYNLMGNFFVAQANIAYDRLLVTFPVSFQHWIADDKNYLATVSAGNVNNFLIGESQLGQVGVIYENHDYMRSSRFPNESRSGNELIGTAGWFWFFAEREGFVNLRYAFHKDWTNGTNWEYVGNRIGAGALYPLCDKVKISVNGEIFFQDFDNRNIIFDKKRDDQTYA
ncbi:MAG: tetratricopeptide repeat protein, partial [Candidatus Omnitrophica bacterium]|nr:tetratricopeptide repeat protein [Candidatus Omnitrophota bacterium]